MKGEKIGTIVQIIGASLVLIGIIYELVARASPGLILISPGSIIFAIGVKLRKG